MSDTREFHSVVHAAEQAAAAGDYKSAEELLHAAALLQEASLGPLHPDLANTLNNLGVVGVDDDVHVSLFVLDYIRTN